MSLLEQIKARLPITVADYMALCNAHYYATRDPLGAGGDFTTAPEISQIFGEVCGAWLARAWMDSGKPEAALMELGPGRGTLMKDILRATKNIPGFHEAISIHLVETSPVLIAAQRNNLEGAHPRISWVENASCETLENKSILLIANEFFDALPIKQLIDKKPRRILWENDSLRFDSVGDIHESCPAAEAILHTLGGYMKTHGGAGLIIDYGYTHGHGDTLQAVRNHKYVNPLENPGEADLTAHVDFAALSRVAESAGLKAEVTTQGDFLIEMGAEIRAAVLSKNASPEQREAIRSGLERLVSPQQMGTLFKVLRIQC